ncbi:MAG TPA: tetratricopeptide repeat protein [Polyangia bacterium]|jgi:hypothetical protein
MNGAGDCRSELVVQARRGQLSEQGRLALDAHLAACSACRLAREVSADFDDADAVDLHDGARIRSLGDLARRKTWGQARAPARLRAVAVAAAVVIFCGSASAAVWWWRRPVPAARRAATPLELPPRARVQVRSASPAALAPPLPVVPAPTTLARARVSHPATKTLALVHTGDGETAGALLRAATEARQQGERSRAAELYRRLQREFPASREAVLSAVSLGGLLLDDGLPRAALGQFDGYLAGARGGALIPEALYGRARALARLGDRAEERKTWTRLCTDFPDSAYAPLGRRRLAEIE